MFGLMTETPGKGFSYFGEGYSILLLHSVGANSYFIQSRTNHLHFCSTFNKLSKLPLQFLWFPAPPLLLNTGKTYLDLLVKQSQRSEKPGPVSTFGGLIYIKEKKKKKEIIKQSYKNGGIPKVFIF